MLIFTDNKYEYFLKLIYAEILMYVEFFMKFYYQEERPYMRNSEILANECKCTYGNPSFISGGLVYIYLVIFSDYPKLRKLTKIVIYNSLFIVF